MPLDLDALRAAARDGVDGVLRHVEEAAARFDACGRHFGVGFQLADDLKDLVGGDGKDRFSDLKNQNPAFQCAPFFRG